MLGATHYQAMAFCGVGGQGDGNWMDEQQRESSEWGWWRKEKKRKMVKNEWVELIAKDQMIVAACQVKLV